MIAYFKIDKKTYAINNNFKLYLYAKVKKEEKCIIN